jgi:hypothetical protein
MTEFRKVLAHLIEVAVLAKIRRFFKICGREDAEYIQLDELKDGVTIIDKGAETWFVQYDKNEQFVSLTPSANVFTIFYDWSKIDYTYNKDTGGIITPGFVTRIERTSKDV